MYTIKIVKETGCFMYMDENNNMVDAFFLNVYRFNQLSDKLLNALKARLEMEKVILLGIYGNLFTDKLYLVCKNRKFAEQDYTFTFSYSPDGTENALGHDYFEKYVDKNFNLLQDFTESKRIVG